MQNGLCKLMNNPLIVVKILIIYAFDKKWQLLYNNKKEGFVLKNSKNNLKYLIIIAIFLISGLQLIFCDYNALAYTTYTLSGSGTSSSPYLIKSLADLNGFRDNINNNRNTSKYYKLTVDINFNSSAFAPIGTYSYKFSGTFDGDYHHLYNVNFSANDTDCGLFAYVSGTVKNLYLESGTCKLNSEYSSGAAIGSMYGSGKLENVINKGVKITANFSGNTNAGGLVGCLGSDSSVTITNCENYAAISNKCYGSTAVCSGGIVGRDFSGGSSSISSCGNRGTITAGTTLNVYSYAGGIIGNSSKTSISNCFNTGGIYSYAKENSYSSDPANSVSSGQMSSSSYNMVEKKTLAYAGGIVGYYTGVVSNCYSTGSIKGGVNHVTITNITRFLVNSTTGGGSPTNYSSTYTLSSSSTNVYVKTVFNFDYECYYSGINGKTDVSNGTCYSTIDNCISNASYYSYKNKVTNTSSTTYSRSGRIEKQTNNSSETGYSLINSKTGGNYSSDFKCTFDCEVSDYNNEYLLFSHSGKTIKLVFYALHEYSTGALWWKEDHADTITITPYSITTKRQNGCSTTSIDTLKGSSSPFKSGVWAIDSKINAGILFSLSSTYLATERQETQLKLTIPTINTKSHINLDDLIVPPIIRTTKPTTTNKLVIEIVENIFCNFVFPIIILLLSNYIIPNNTSIVKQI